MTRFMAPDGETEEVDETTRYWTKSRDALGGFSPTEDILIGFSPTIDGVYGLKDVELPGTGKTVIMVCDFACPAMRKGWTKYYMRFPTSKDLVNLSREIMET